MMKPYVLIVAAVIAAICPQTSSAQLEVPFGEVTIRGTYYCSTFEKAKEILSEIEKTEYRKWDELLQKEMGLHGCMSRTLEAVAIRYAKDEQGQILEYTDSDGDQWHIVVAKPTGGLSVDELEVLLDSNEQGYVFVMTITPFVDAIEI